MRRSATPAEQALIQAVGAPLRRHAAGADRAPLDKAYADAMAEAARAFPNNDTIQVLFAESLMDLSPWDYWEAGGTRPKSRTAETGRCARTRAGTQSHPSGRRPLLHPRDGSLDPSRKSAAAGARAGAARSPAPATSCTCLRTSTTGSACTRKRWQSNLEAIAADESYFRRSGSDPVYKGAYYPHNIHFVMVSALMGGDGKTALDAAAKLDKSLPPRTAQGLRRHAAGQGGALLLARPVQQPGRAGGAARSRARTSCWSRPCGTTRAPSALRARGRWPKAARKSTRSASWNARPTSSRSPTGRVPAKEIVHTARAVATGRLADAQGDLPGAIKAYQEAVAVQDSLPYTEPPYWYYPVRQSLGAALLRAGQLDAAEQVFRASLARTPSNGWALRGLIEVYRKRGDTAALAATRKRFETTWLGKKEARPVAVVSQRSARAAPGHDSGRSVSPFILLRTSARPPRTFS